MKLDYKVEKESILKDYLLEIGLSRRFCRRVKLYGKIYLNGKETKNFVNVFPGDIITLEYEEEENEEILSKEANLDIRYEDEHILVINKPEGLTSQPSRLHYEDNVISYVKSYLQKNNISTNVHVVTRLDFQTSGLMIIAKDGHTHYLLTKDNIIEKRYKAIVSGILIEKQGLIDLPIARKDEISILREINISGKKAVTEYKVLKEIKNKSLVEVKLHTGRTHQIRVHFSALGHPLIGDKLYGKEEKRLMLHCYYLRFKNPYYNNSDNNSLHKLEFIEIKCEPDFELDE